MSEHDLPPAVADAFEAMDRGATYAEAGLRVGVSGATVGRWRTAFGYRQQNRQKRHPPVVDGLIRHLAAQGWLIAGPDEDDWVEIQRDVRAYLCSRNASHMTGVAADHSRSRSRWTMNERKRMAEAYINLRKSERDPRKSAAQLAEWGITASDARRWCTRFFGHGSHRVGVNTQDFTRSAILNALGASPDGLTVKDLAAVSGANYGAVYAQLGKLAQEGIVVRPGVHSSPHQRTYRMAVASAAA